MSAAAGERRSLNWYRHYVARVAVTDAVIVVVALSTAYWVRFDPAGEAAVSGQLAPSYLAVSIGLMVAWLAVLDLGRSRDRRLVGHGAAEYSRVFSLSARLFAGMAIVSYLLRMDVSRGYLAIAAPLGTGMLLVGRYGWRRWLHRRWTAGSARSRMLAVGHVDQVTALVAAIARNRTSAYEVVGVCTPLPPAPGTAPAEAQVHGVPVVGSFDDAAACAERLDARVVAVSGSDAITAEAVRHLGWDLEGKGIDLALAPALTDIAGPRVVMQPAGGLPLIYVDEPRFTGAKYAAKSAFDWAAAAVAVAVLSPLLLAAAVAVKVTSPGPVLYRQTRIGRGNRPFQMLKFRSMSVDAHARLAEVLAAEGLDGVPLFYKPRNDPRVTPLGRTLRKYSIDELPQLINVLRGDMSLVGPRPQIDQEVALYDRTATRRLLVKPGLTGLWQVSGRSDLSTVDGIRADVYYVENWTLLTDIAILARTVRVVLRGHGAY